MSKSTGGSNYALVFAMTDDTTIDGLTAADAIYVFNHVTTSNHAAQASGLKDITLTDDQYDDLYTELMKTVLPVDPSAGSAATTATEYEDGSGGGSASSAVPNVFVIYLGAQTATKRESIAQVMKFDRTSENLAATKSSTVNNAVPKLIAQKPAGTITAPLELWPSAKVDQPSADVVITPSTLRDWRWLDIP